MVLADEAVLGRTRGVEVAQEDALEAVGAVAVLADLLQHELGAAVGVDRVLFLRLGNRDLRGLAVGGAGGGEDEALRAGQNHGAQQHERLGDVVLVVLQRVLHGLAHLNEGGEVNDGIELAVDEQRIDDGGIAEIALHELDFRIDDGGGVAVDHAVENGHISAALHELAHGVRTNVAGTAGNEYFHDGMMYWS